MGAPARHRQLNLLAMSEQVLPSPLAGLHCLPHLRWHTLVCSPDAGRDPRHLASSHHRCSPHRTETKKASPMLREHTDTPPAPPDPTLQDATARMLQVMEGGSLALLVALGHDTGLLRTLGDLPPSTSAQIADAAGLQERYVREWLAAATCGRLICYQPGEGTYRLPPAAAAVLTGDGADNLARSLSMLGELTRVLPRVRDCFSTGGGTGYRDYPRFQEAMAEESAAVHDAALIDHILPVTDRTDQLETGIDVADIGCGRGHAVNLIAQRYPHSRVTGYDFLPEPLEVARAEAAAMGLTNAEFVCRDAAHLEAPGQFDLVTAFDAIHDQAYPDRVLAEIRRSLRPGGVFLMVDFRASSNLEENVELPWGAYLYTVSLLHCMTISLGQGGAGLGSGWGTQLATRMLGAAGFTDVQMTTLDSDPFNVYFRAVA